VTGPRFVALALLVSMASLLLFAAVVVAIRVTGG
jgi:hypothetical protein